METKKVLAVIFSLIFVCAFAFVLVWGIINFNKVKDGMSGSGVYTKEDLNKSYEDGYNTALTDKEEYVTLIAGYRDTITTLNDNVSQLTSQVTILKNNNKDYSKQVETLSTQKNDLQKQVDNLTIIKTNNDKTISDLNTQISNLQKQVTDLTKSGEDKSEQISQLNNQIINLQNTVSQLQTTNDMNLNTITSLNTQIANLNNQISEMTLLSQTANTQIASLNNKINELQKSITYYESYIAQLENGEQVVATFEFDGSVYNIQIVNKGSKLSVTTPASTDYKIFNGWKINGSIVDLSTYIINTNTKIVADITYKYDVKFKVDDTVYNNQIITKNGYATLPANPTKTGYEFDGWSLNGVDVISDITTKQVTENTTYVAVFTKLHTVTFIYENETKSTQTIRNGKFATTVNIDNTDYKIFNGWKINDTIVDLSTYKIVADTTFIADITYKYDVIFKVDNTIYNSQIVAKNGYATLPTNPTKDGYEFNGWSLNGTDIISNIDSLQITDNVTYIAIFKYVPTLSEAFSGFFVQPEDVWSDGTNYYYCSGKEDQYKFNKSGYYASDKFIKINFNGDRKTYISGRYFWTDGTNIYYSNGSDSQYIYDKATRTLTSITFNNFNDFKGNCVWSDGSNYYLSLKKYNSSTSSYDYNHYIFNKETLSWDTMTWGGCNEFCYSKTSTQSSSCDIWTDGSDWYLKNEYILNKSTKTWEKITPIDFSELKSFYFSYRNIVVMNNKCFYLFSNSGNNVYDHFIFNKETKQWERINLNIKYVSAEWIWSDGVDYYFYRNSNSKITYKFNLG